MFSGQTFRIYNEINTLFAIGDTTAETGRNCSFNNSLSGKNVNNQVGNNYLVNL